MKAKILVVDDEEKIRSSLKELLDLEGYDVDAVEGGKEALDRVEEEEFDVMVLDLKMPGVDGLEVVRKAVHVSPSTRIVLLTGHGSLESAIEAIRNNVSDYLEKPVKTHELLTSIQRALAKRTEQQQRRLLLEQLDSAVQRLKGVEGIDGPPSYEQDLVTFENGLAFDFSRREIWLGNERVSLTPTEGKLMKVFLESRGRVLSHGELVFLVQGYETSEIEAPEVLRPLISRLRRKLSAFPNGEKWIQNVRGTGYVLELPGDRENLAARM